MVSTGLGPLHHRHPLVVVAEEREVEVRAAAVGLSADGKLAEQPPHRLSVAAVFGVDYSVLKSEADTDRRFGYGGEGGGGGREREGKGCQQNKMKKQQEFSRGNYWFNSAVWPLR